MRLEIGVAIVVCVAFLHSDADGQSVLGANWLSDLNKSLSSLNRNIHENVQQLNQRIAETVNTEVTQAQQLTDNLNKAINAGQIQAPRSLIASGQNVFVSDSNGTSTVLSGRTNNGTAYSVQITETIEGNTLRSVTKIYYPNMNITKIHEFTLDISNPNAQPVVVQ